MSLACRQRIRPPQARKPRKVAIRRAQRRAMLHRDSRDNSIHHQCASRLTFFHELAKNVPMTLTRFEDASVGLRKPGSNRRIGLRRREWALKHPRMSPDSKKRPQRQPCKADEFRPAERRLDPGAACLMLLRTRMVGIEQQVRIDEDHRCNEPST